MTEQCNFFHLGWSFELCQKNITLDCDQRGFSGRSTRVAMLGNSVNNCAHLHVACTFSTHELRGALSIQPNIPVWFRIERIVQAFPQYCSLGFFNEYVMAIGLSGVQFGLHLRLVSVWSQTIADRRSQTIETCFHIIADDLKQSQNRLLHTSRTAEESKLHARCTSEKIAANSMADIEGEILLQAKLFFFYSQPILKFSWHISLRPRR